MSCSRVRDINPLGNLQHNTCYKRIYCLSSDKQTSYCQVCVEQEENTVSQF